jgi:hypothetical protein
MSMQCNKRSLLRVDNLWPRYLFTITSYVPIRLGIGLRTVATQVVNPSHMRTLALRGVINCWKNHLSL